MPASKHRNRPAPANLQDDSLRARRIRICHSPPLAAVHARCQRAIRQDFGTGLESYILLCHRIPAGSGHRRCGVLQVLAEDNLSSPARKRQQAEPDHRKRIHGPGHTKSGRGKGLQRISQRNPHPLGNCEPGGHSACDSNPASLSKTTRNLNNPR